MSLELGVLKTQKSSPNIFSTSHGDYRPLELKDGQSLQVNRADGAKRACLVGLLLSVLVGIAAIVVGIVSKGSQKTWHLSPAAKELITLPINILLLAVTECLGYIHAASLRWALFHEGRLEFNTNLRLSTFSTTSTPNGAFFSILFFVCMALTYATGNMLLVFNTSAFYTTSLNYGTSVTFDSVKDLVSLTRAMPLCLGVAILVMSLIALWSIKRTVMPSWSSDPLNTATIGLNTSLVRHKGRAMMSVHDRHADSSPRQPNRRQQSSRSVSNWVLRIFILAILILVALVIWSSVIVYVGYRNGNGTSWGFFPTTTGDFSIIDGETGTSLKNPASATLTVFLFFFADAGDGYLKTIPEARMLGVLAFYLVIQSVFTVGLHCAELQCQLVRDEAIWRDVGSSEGRLQSSIYNSIIQPLQSWQGAGLLIFKVVVHWLFGFAMTVDYGQGVLMRPPQIVYLTVAWLLFVVFLAAVTMKRPAGCLPTAYGHLQTMVDVADEWNERMYWGDKGLLADGDTGAGMRHAGTSSEQLPAVIEDQFYS